jgi:TP901 family phage tail tape measure protein
MAAPAAVLQVLVTANTAQANAALAKTQAQLQATTASAQKAGASSAAAGSAMSKNLVRGAGGVAAVLGASVVAAVKFEDAFADVRKTVDASEAQFKQMEQGIRNLALEIPIAVTELAKLAGTAGALGVPAKKIVEFTRVAAMLGTATDLAAEDAATALARLGNVLGQETVKDFQRMGATLVDLGNKGASTESEITEMSLRISRSGGIVGLTAKQVLGLAASLSNVGIKAEAGGTAVSRALLTMNEAIKLGGVELQTFSQVAGLSAEKFAKLFATDAPTALGLFAEGLVKMNEAGKPVVGTLEKVGLNEIRVRDALLGLGQAQGEVAKGQGIANEAWKKNSALVEEAQKRYDTTGSKFRLLLNAINDVGISIGKMLNPAVRDGLKVFGGFVVVIASVVKWLEKTGHETSVLGKFIRQMGQNFQLVVTGPIPLLIKVGQKLSGVFQAVADAFRTVKTAAVSSFNAIKGPVVSAGKAVITVLAKIVRVVSSVISAFQKLSDAPGDILDKGVGALEDVGGFILKQRGGKIGRYVGGRGTGDSVPALLEPGEVVLNRRAVAAMGGAHRANQINQEIPRFAGGGIAGGVGAAGKAGIRATSLAARDLMEVAFKQAKRGNVAGSGDIVALGRSLQKQGYTVGEHPAFGGVSGVHVAGSYHYRGRALDINADSMPGGEMANLDRLNKQLLKNPNVVELLWRVANHFDHLHVAMQQGGIVGDFARAGVDTKATKRAMYALFMAGMAESGMRDLGYGDASSQGVLQLLASTARSTGINPHDEYGVAKGFLTRGYWGKGGAINLAKQGVAPAMIAHLVQGNATGTGVYSAQGGAARNLLQSSGLRFPPGGKGAATLAKANVPPKVKPEKGKTKDAEWALTYTPKMLDRINRLGGDAGLIAMAADFASRAASLDTAVGGKDEAGWLNEQLAHMITLRNLLIDAYLWVQEVIRRYQEAIDAAQKQLKKINDSLKGKRITASAGLTKKRDDLKAQIAKWKSRRDASAAFLAGDDGPIARLDTLQGFVNPESLRFAKAASLAVGPYGGQIAEVQGSLKSLGENAADTGASDTSSATDNSAMIALLQEQANNLAKQLFVSEQSFKVLSQTPGPPYVGSFAQGGIVPGSGPKLATVHGGEHIGQPSPIVILVQDGAVNADRIRAISGRQAEQMARRAGRGRIPGRAGSMG